MNFAAVINHRYSKSTAPSLTVARHTFSLPPMSKLPFELLLALRYLRPKRTFVSIITLISILGVALGVAVLIIVISVMSGFDHDLREKILGFNAHLKVYALDQSGRTGTMKNYGRVMDLVAANKNVRGVTPFIFGPVLVETQAETNRPSLQDAPMLRGIDPQTEDKVSNLPRSVREGKFDLSGRGLLVGNDFARNLNLRIGDHLSIYSAREIKKMKAGRDKNEDTAILPDDYEVRGIFNVGYYDYDARVIVVSLDNAQDLYDLGDSVHGLLVMLQDPYQAPVLDGGKFGDSQRARRRKERHVYFVALYCRGRVSLHVERANHICNPKNPGNRNAESTWRKEPANFRGLFGPKRDHRCAWRDCGFGTGNPRSNLSQ
jgi:hypothetical protein